MAASTKKRELNDMNAIACLLVILIHVLSLGISSVTPTSWQAAVIYFPWRLAAFVVPMFLYTGAVKMALTRRSPSADISAICSSAFRKFISPMCCGW